MEELRFPNPPSPGISALLIAIATVYTLLCIVTMATMVARRHRRLLAVREPWLILTETSYGLITHIITMVTILIGETHATCELLGFVYALFLPIWALPYFLMFPSVVIGSDLNQMKVSRHSSHVATTSRVNPETGAEVAGLPPAQSKQGKTGFVVAMETEEKQALVEGSGGDWRWRVKRLATLRGKFIMVLVASVVHLATFVGLRYARGGQPGYCLQETLLVICAGEVLYGLMLLYFLIKIFRVKDPFFMKIELILNSLVFFPILAFTFIFPIIPDRFPDHFDIRYALLACPILGFLFNCLFPTILSFEAVQRAISRCHGNQSLDEEELLRLDKGGHFLNEHHHVLNSKEVMRLMLSDQIMLEAFTQYCVQNWCVENVLFYKSAEEFSEAFADPNFDAPTRAGRIIKEFIENRSALEVNIENQLRQTILAEFRGGEIRRELFQRAQNSIFDLMYRDSFQKWIKTPEFKDALMVCVGTQRKSSSFGSTIRMMGNRRPSNDSLRGEKY